MSISDAINNARNKINNAYSALEVKGAEIPAVKDLNNITSAINSVSSQIFNWNYKGFPDGHVLLDSYSPEAANSIKVPFGNYIRINAPSANSPFFSKDLLEHVDLSLIPFEGSSMDGVFLGCSSLKTVTNVQVKNGVSSVNDAFKNCYSVTKVSSNNGYDGTAWIKFSNSVTSAQNVYQNCKSISSFVIDGYGVSTLNGAFRYCNYDRPYTSVHVLSPNVSSAVNLWNNYTTSNTIEPVKTKEIFCYWQDENGVNTTTFNTLKANSTYTAGLSPAPGTSYYFNVTSGFRLSDLGVVRNLLQSDISNNEVTYQKYTGSGDSVSLWAPYPGYSVSQVYSNCFLNSNIYSVNFLGVPVENNSLYEGFKNCQNLDSVHWLNENITNMERTFYGCSNFNQNVQIPSSVNNVVNTFYNCYNLNQNIQIPSSVTNMRGTFDGCNSLNRKIKIPDGVEDMHSTFGSCSSLNQNIQIPSSVRNLAYTFELCSSLNQNIQIPSSVTNMECTFILCTGLSKNIKVLSSEIKSASACFTGTSAAKKLYIPYFYANGSYTETFNAFKTAGYIKPDGTTNNQDGVTVYDLNQI